MSNSSDILNHIAIPIGFHKDIVNFYIDILGFSEQYIFDLDQETAGDIFRSDKAVRVNVIERDGLVLELFQTDGKTNPGFAHICLNVLSVEDVRLKAQTGGYKVITVKRPSGKIAFIADTTGNLFEIKEI